MRVLITIAKYATGGLLLLALALGGLALLLEKFLIEETVFARWSSPAGGAAIVAVERNGGATTSTVLFLYVEREGWRSWPFFKASSDDYVRTMDVRWHSNSSAYVSLGSEPVNLRGEGGGLRNTVLGVDVEVGP